MNHALMLAVLTINVACVFVNHYEGNYKASAISAFVTGFMSATLFIAFAGR